MRRLQTTREDIGLAVVASIILCLIWTTAPNVEGAGEASSAKGRPWSVVIGVTSYLDPSVAEWEAGVPDARLVYTALVERAGCDAERVLLLCDDQDKVHLRPLGLNIRTQVATWLRRASAEDTVLVFYAGRAFVSDRGSAYLAPQECEKGRKEETAIPIDSLHEMLFQCNASQKMVIFAAGSASPQLAKSLSDIDGLTALACSSDVVMPLAQSGRKETLFSTCLARGLSGEADANDDRMIDTHELCTYVVKQVREVGGKGTTIPLPVVVAGKGVAVVPIAQVSEKPQVDQTAHPPQPGRQQAGARQGFVPRPLAGGSLPKHITNSIGMKLVLIPPGEFMMGSPESEVGHESHESPQHPARISKPFYMGVCEVTRREFAEVMRGCAEYQEVANSEQKKSANSYVRLPQDYARLDAYPQLFVTWEEAVRFSRRLTAIAEERRSGRSYRLPTEAEWEYACRAGTATPFNIGSEPDTEHFAYNGERYGDGLLNKPTKLQKTGSFPPQRSASTICTETPSNGVQTLTNATIMQSPHLKIRRDHHPVR